MRAQILGHPVYSAITTVEELQIFMQYYVYAVWDFMSLLKSLQNSLTCTRVPWFPMQDSETVHLINEIVAGEESDTDANGNRKSHYNMYLDAMRQCGSDVYEILRFTSRLEQSGNFSEAYNEAGTPSEAREFVNFTFDVIGSGKDYLQSAIFTFGREDLIPGMFVGIVSDLATRFPEDISLFDYYLQRHIELDGDHHSHLALQMTSNLCGNDQAKWSEVEQTVLASLRQRLLLWDGAHRAIQLRQARRTATTDAGKRGE